MLTLNVHDKALENRFQAEMLDVEARFSAELMSDLSCVNHLAGHIERFRGKMLRPMLVLVSGMAIAPEDEASPESILVLATVTEMVHMATLVHDDVLDEAELRRKGATINHLRGNEAAVMLGDYLISHAYHLCSSLDDQKIARHIASTTNVVCEGELLQLANRNNWSLDQRTYYEIIRRKTAALTATCCSLAAVLHGASEATIAGLNRYGENLGVAFQIIDDVLDLTGDEATVGKTLGRDLFKGKLTLPLIHTLEHLDTSEKTRMINLLEEQRDDELTQAQRTDLVDEIRQFVFDGDGIEASRQRASDLIEHAQSAITDTLPDSSARTMLLEVAGMVVKRRY